MVFRGPGPRVPPPGQPDPNPPPPPPGAAQNPLKRRGLPIPGQPNPFGPGGAVNPIANPDLWAFDLQGRIDSGTENLDELRNNPNAKFRNLPWAPEEIPRNAGMPVGTELPIIGPMDYPNNAPPRLPAYYGTPFEMPPPSYWENKLPFGP